MTGILGKDLYSFENSDTYEYKTCGAKLAMNLLVIGAHYLLCLSYTVGFIPSLMSALVLQLPPQEHGIGASLVFGVLLHHGLVMAFLICMRLV